MDEKTKAWAFPGVPVVKNSHSNTGGPGSVLARELRSHNVAGQLRPSAAAAAAAKLLQSRPTLCDPIDGSPPGSPVPRILQARTLEWFAISFSNA